MKMDELICCFTGHRTLEKRHLSRLPDRLSGILKEKYREGYRVFRAGGALGFDTVAALSVLDLKRDCPDVRLELMLPCRDQAAKWGDTDVQIYYSIIERADSVIYASENYAPGCMHKRNRMLVEGASCCVAYFNTAKTERSGTAYTYEYARDRGLELINVWTDSGFFSRFR